MAQSDKADEKPAAQSNSNIFGYISFFVAALSLVATIYQSYLNTRYVELIQTSVARAETARTCKDLIDAYFQIKFKTSASPPRLSARKIRIAPSVIAASSEALNSVSRFAALRHLSRELPGRRPARAIHRALERTKARGRSRA